jgi:hypothetical protein
MRAEGALHTSLNGARMTWPTEHYRKLASEAREQAAASTLPQVKLRCLRSAEHFEEIIVGMEHVAKAKARNEAARSEGVA